MLGPTIVSRDDWNARPAQGRVTRMSRYDGFVIHHTAGPQTEGLDDGIEKVRAIQRLHQKDRGWIDIGYNFLVDGGGNIFEGRGWVESHLARGAHAPGVNSSRVGISLMGCFHPAESGCDDQPTPQQIDSLVELCQFLTVRFWISPAILSGHRDHRATACPGDELFAELPEIRDRIGGAYTLEIESPLEA